MLRKRFRVNNYVKLLIQQYKRNKFIKLVK
jgi:hypothetical protein